MDYLLKNLFLPVERSNGCRALIHGDRLPDEKTFRIAILGATLDATNMGVGALAAGAVRCLCHAYPRADIYFLDYAKQRAVRTLKLNEREVSLPLVNMRFSRRFYLPNNISMLLLIAILLKTIPSKKFLNWICAKNAWFSEIYSTDLFASISGGDSFSDIYGMGRLLYVSLPQILVLLLGKKLVLLPQTIGPFKAAFAKKTARYILRGADRVYSRDEQGLGEIKALAGSGQADSKFGFCYDVGFVLDPVAPARVDVMGLPALRETARPLVGLNVSGLLLIGGYTRNNMFGLAVDYRELIEDIVHFLIDQKGASVLLVPHVFGGSADTESDTRACEQVYEELREKYPGRLGVLRGKYNQNEIKFVIGQCDFLIGARMHACIAAVSQSIPAVCLAYSDKFIGVMRTVGVDSIVADMRRLDAAGILAVIESSMDNRSAIHLRLERKMSEVRSRVLNLFEPTGGFAGNAPVEDEAKASPVAADA